MRIVSVRLPDDVYERLRKRASERGMSVSEYVREILVREAYSIDVEKLAELERRVRKLEADVTMLRSWILRLLGRNIEEEGEEFEG